MLHHNTAGQSVVLWPFFVFAADPSLYLAQLLPALCSFASLALPLRPCLRKLFALILRMGFGKALGAMAQKVCLL